MGDANVHNHKRVPLFLAGHASGQLKGNLHVQEAEGTPVANVLLASVLQKLGIDADSVRGQHLPPRRSKIHPDLKSKRR